MDNLLVSGLQNPVHDGPFTETSNSGRELKPKLYLFEGTEVKGVLEASVLELLSLKFQWYQSRDRDGEGVDAYIRLTQMIWSRNINLGVFRIWDCGGGDKITKQKVKNGKEYGSCFKFFFFSLRNLNSSSQWEEKGLKQGWKEQSEIRKPTRGRATTEAERRKYFKEKGAVHYEEWR